MGGGGVPSSEPFQVSGPSGAPELLQYQSLCHLSHTNEMVLLCVGTARGIIHEASVNLLLYGDSLQNGKRRLHSSSLHTQTHPDGCVITHEQVATLCCWGENRKRRKRNCCGGFWEGNHRQAARVVRCSPTQSASKVGTFQQAKAWGWLWAGLACTTHGPPAVSKPHSRTGKSIGRKRQKSRDVKCFSNQEGKNGRNVSGPFLFLLSCCRSFFRKAPKKQKVQSFSGCDTFFTAVQRVK